MWKNVQVSLISMLVNTFVSTLVSQFVSMLLNKFISRLVSQFVSMLVHVSLSARWSLSLWVYWWLNLSVHWWLSFSVCWSVHVSWTVHWPFSYQYICEYVGELAVNHILVDRLDFSGHLYSVPSSAKHVDAVHGFCAWFQDWCLRPQKNWTLKTFLAPSSPTESWKFVGTVRWC